MITSLYCAADALLGEGPRWIEDGGGRLVWVDLLNAQVLGRGETGAVEVLWQAPEVTASAVMPLGGGYAVAMHRSIALLDTHWQLRAEVGLDGLPRGVRLSDATAGPDGALWVGAVPAEGSAVASGSLYRVTRDGSAVVLGDVGFSNGLGFSADGRRLFHIDSATNAVSEHPVHPESGTLGAGRVLYQHDVPGETLDGLAVDAADRLWIAVFGGRRVLGIDPGRGVVAEISLPASRTTSCAFGPDGRLFVTTATVGQSPAERVTEADAGSVFVCVAGIAGGPMWKGAIG